MISHLCFEIYTSAFEVPDLINLDCDTEHSILNMNILPRNFYKTLLEIVCYVKVPMLNGLA